MVLLGLVWMMMNKNKNKYKGGQHVSGYKR